MHFTTTYFNKAATHCDTSIFNNTNCIIIRKVFMTGVALWQWWSTAETCRSGLISYIYLFIYMYVFGCTSCWFCKMNYENLCPVSSERHPKYGNTTYHTAYNCQQNFLVLTVFQKIILAAVVPLFIPVTYHRISFITYTKTQMVNIHNHSCIQIRQVHLLVTQEATWLLFILG
jgi:hypothetical protein